MNFNSATLFKSRERAVEFASSIDSSVSFDNGFTSRGAMDSPDPTHLLIWNAVRHFFPGEAFALQPRPGRLCISWPMDGDPNAMHRMAAPILLRVDDDVLADLLTLDVVQQCRWAQKQVANVQIGMYTYNPYAPNQTVRVIMLG